MSKICKRCRKNKDINLFDKNINCTTDGHVNFCKECQSEKKKIYASENKDKISKIGLRYRQNNKEKIKLIDKEYSKTVRGKEVRRNARLKWVMNNPDKNKESKVKWSINNPDNKKEYYENNKNKIIQKNLENRRNDPHLNLKHKVSGIIRNRIKAKIIGRCKKIDFGFLPYTVNDLINHLESQFEPWMNWGNYGFGRGKWCMDHIVPDCSFIYTSTEDEEFQKCWALSNLRPLDFMDNAKKSKY